LLFFVQASAIRAAALQLARAGTINPLQVFHSSALSAVQATLTASMVPIVSAPTTTVESEGASPSLLGSSVIYRETSSMLEPEGGRQRMPSPNITTVTDLMHSVSELMLDFVVPTADALLNLSAAVSHSLTQAVVDLSASISARLRSQAPENNTASSAVNVALRASVEKLATALLAAEKEVFYLLVSGPVFRLVQRAAYADWATGVLGEVALTE
jgi:hypothetical protein